MKKKETPLEEFIGYLVAIIIIQLISVPFYLLGNQKWGISISALILFLSLVRIAFIRNK